VSKCEALSYFTDRKAKEVFVDHKNLDFRKIKIEELHDPHLNGKASAIDHNRSEQFDHLRPVLSVCF